MQFCAVEIGMWLRYQNQTAIVLCKAEDCVLLEFEPEWCLDSYTGDYRLADEQGRRLLLLYEAQFDARGFTLVK